MKIYIASPFFNEIELFEVQQVENILKEKGLDFFSPRLSDANTTERSKEMGTRKWSIETFHDDIKRIHWCDVMVCVYHGMYSDSGTAMEVGYAHALGKPIIVVHVHDEKNFSNLMIHEAGYANLSMAEFYRYDFSKMPTNYWQGKCL